MTDGQLLNKPLRQTIKRKLDHKPCIAHMNGNISELMVAADLIAKEYWVFNSVVGNTPFDFVAVKKDRFLKVEVKTARKANTGRSFYTPPRNDFSDVIALYFPEEDRIEYHPSIV